MSFRIVMKCENFSFSCKKVGKKFVRFIFLLYLCIRFRAKNSDGGIEERVL